MTELATWIRVAIVAAVLAVITAGVLAVRAHWIGVGKDIVQTRWNTQIKNDALAGVQLAQERARDQALVNRNAERTADEDHRREQVRLDRIALAERTAAGLRDAIAKLDADDLSAAAADPRVAAIARRAVAARGFLGQCAERYTGLAGRTARLRDQVTGLQAFALNVCHAGAPAQPSTPITEQNKEVTQ